MKQRNWSQNKKLKIFPPNIAKKEIEAVAKSKKFSSPPPIWKNGKRENNHPFHLFIVLLNYLFFVSLRLMFKSIYLLFNFLQLPIRQPIGGRILLCQQQCAIFFLTATGTILVITIIRFSMSTIFILLFFWCVMGDVRADLRAIFFIILRAAFHFHILSISHVVSDCENKCFAAQQAHSDNP